MGLRASRIALVVLGLVCAGAFAVRAEPAAAPGDSPVASDVRVGGDAKLTRFVVDLSRKVEIRAFTLFVGGGQIRVPGYGALLLPVQDKRLQEGLYTFPKSRLYISRGVGYLARASFCCRPEVPIFTMTRASS